MLCQCALHACPRFDRSAILAGIMTYRLFVRSYCYCYCCQLREEHSEKPAERTYFLVQRSIKLQMLPSQLYTQFIDLACTLDIRLHDHCIITHCAPNPATLISTYCHLFHCKHHVQCKSSRHRRWQQVYQQARINCTSNSSKHECCTNNTSSGSSSHRRRASSSSRRYKPQYARIRYTNNK